MLPDENDGLEDHRGESEVTYRRVLVATDNDCSCPRLRVRLRTVRLPVGRARVVAVRRRGGAGRQTVRNGTPPLGYDCTECDPDGLGNGRAPAPKRSLGPSVRGAERAGGLDVLSRCAACPGYPWRYVRESITRRRPCCHGDSQAQEPHRNSSGTSLSRLGTAHRRHREQAGLDASAARALSGHN